MPLRQSRPNVTIILTLLLASTILGLLTGLFYRIWAVGLLSVLIAILSALVLHFFGFRFLEGVAVSVLCLIVCQLAYWVASLRFLKGPDLSQDEIDGCPGDERDQDVEDENR
ncbi:hypothetical protein DAA51_36730 [Bradyrhizobium sp. WBAH10]|nr:hypothetical protein [Bradyrhizobium sp. WBAH41]MDD1590405.1 hypothetical protein [Bradyrhizobium sp. WBAH42]NRB88112.1 hypothetical protein [Bradyrhizobium sp. WBAH10]QCJ78671.1 hypothetical protein DAA51_36730 [Bradyrhizobium sp. WBAH10]QCJ93426.1 hypothetical protein DAA57_36975 [Bradyrhizobium yuanmingense]